TASSSVSYVALSIRATSAELSSSGGTLSSPPLEGSPVSPPSSGSPASSGDAGGVESSGVSGVSGVSGGSCPSVPPSVSCVTGVSSMGGSTVSPAATDGTASVSIIHSAIKIDKNRFFMVLSSSMISFPVLDNWLPQNFRFV